LTIAKLDGAQYNKAKTESVVDHAESDELAWLSPLALTQYRAMCNGLRVELSAAQLTGARAAADKMQAAKSPGCDPS
jgi:hypothetical protein